jgi:hypothetical protein
VDTWIRQLGLSFPQTRGAWHWCNIRLLIEKQRKLNGFTRAWRKLATTRRMKGQQGAHGTKAISYLANADFHMDVPCHMAKER